MAYKLRQVTHIDKAHPFRNHDLVCHGDDGDDGDGRSHQVSFQQHHGDHGDHGHHGDHGDRGHHGDHDACPHSQSPLQKEMKNVYNMAKI